MIIGDVGFSKVVGLLYIAQETLGREINPIIFNSVDWTQLQKRKDAFLIEVLSKPRMDVMGDSHELG